MNTKSLKLLLDDIIEDNNTFNFPYDDIKMELLSMLLHKDEMLYFVQQITKRLTSIHSKDMAKIFVGLLNKYTQDNNADLQNMTDDEYMNFVDGFIQELQDIQITIVPKNSPDGEMLKFL